MGVPPLVVMGVSGSGKSTVAEGVAARITGADFLDADDFHSDAAKAKMAAGHALNDVDRAPWLTRVGRGMGAVTTAGRIPIMACSSLERAHRRRILAEEPNAFFVLLDVAEPELVRRMKARRGHYMPFTLLASQLATLEPLGPDEPGLALPIAGPREQVVERLVAAVVTRR